MPIINTQLKGGGVQPSGTKSISANGVYDVSIYANADVQVPQPSGTATIQSNGTYDITNYATAEVQVPTTAPDIYIKKEVNGDSIKNTPVFSMNFSGIKKTAEGMFAYQFSSINNEFSADFSKIKSATSSSFYYAFWSSKITSVNFDNIENTEGAYAFNYTFSNCSKITNISFPKLKSVSNSSFDYCFQQSSLLNISFDSLEKTIGSFYRCFHNSSVQTATFPKLTTIYSSRENDVFLSASSLTTCLLPSLKNIQVNMAVNRFFAYSGIKNISFPALTSTSFGSYVNQFNNLIQGIDGCTIHFPNNIQSIIGNWSSITGGLGGTNTTVLFDLPATNILTGANTIEYERNPKDDTATALAWRKVGYDANGFVLDWTSYYTSGLTDPQVNNTIYSDSACTTAVTTIDSIT